MINYFLGDLVTRLNVASKNRLVSIRVQNTNYNIDLLTLFYNNGLISGFRIYPNCIWVFLAYIKHFCVFSKLELVSTPGKRRYWSLNKLQKKYSNTNFAGFYVISSNKGLITSTQAFLSLHTSGEVLLKVYL